MSLVTSWLTRERARLRDLPRLEDALLGDRPWRYAIYRLRYVFVRALLRTALRIVELGLFASVVPFEMLSSVLLIRSGLVITEALWWGALDPLRGDVQRLATEGRTGQASLRIRQWLVLAAMLGVAGCLAAILWIRLGPSTFSSFSIVDVYLIGCTVRWALDLWSTTYHAGIYGVRRVYRPLWSLVLTDIADVVLLGAAFWWLGAWGLGIAVALAGIVRTLIAWSFTRRVYRQLKIALGGPRAWLAAWIKAGWEPSRSFRFALGNAVGEVDALLVLGLIAAPDSPRAALLLAALFHVLAPLQAAASAWSRLFYFDFKRLQAWGSSHLLQRFEAFLDRAMWWVPVPIGVATLGILAAFWRGNYGWLAFELLCFAAVRSRLSLVHVRAYALGDHVFLRRLLLAMLTVAAMAQLAAHLEPHVALGLVTGLAAAALLFVGRSQQGLELRAARGLLGSSIWAALLLREAGPVYVGLARVDRRLTSVGRVERAWRNGMLDAVCARLSHDTLVWFTTTAAEPKHLMALVSGAIRELHLSPCYDGGRAALLGGLPHDAWLRSFGFVSNRKSALAGPGLAARLTGLTQALSAVHPQVQVTPMTIPNPLPDLEPLLRTELRRIILDAARGHAGIRTLGTLDVAVYAPGGVPAALISATTAARPSSPAWRTELALLISRAEISTTLDEASETTTVAPD